MDANHSKSPLSWPPGKPRTEAHRRKQAKFGTGFSNWNNQRNFTIDMAVTELRDEMRRLRVRFAVLLSSLFSV